MTGPVNFGKLGAAFSTKAISQATNVGMTSSPMFNYNAGKVDGDFKPVSEKFAGASYMHSYVQANPDYTAGDLSVVNDDRGRTRFIAY